MLEHSYAHSTTCTIFSMDSNISYTPASSIVARVVADRELVPVCSRRAGAQQWSEAFTDARAAQSVTGMAYLTCTL